MRIYKIIFENGDYFITNFNGSIDQACSYYLGHVFNLGTVSDNMQRCNHVEEVSCIDYPAD